VEIRPVDYGGFNGTYFQNMVENLNKLAGYEVGKTIFGATFDWRPDGLGYLKDGSYAKLKNLIEQAFALNNGTRVHLLGHSGGAPYGHFFLTRYVSQQWKDKYIKTFITMGAPWLGSPTASAFFANFEAVVRGPKLPKIIIDTYRALGLSTGLLVSFLPAEKYSSNDVVISTTKRNYTGAQSMDLLRDTNATQAMAIRKNNVNNYNTIPAPQTELHCLYGYGFDTAQTYVFAGPDFSTLKTVINTTGDDVVTMKSLSFCTTFKTQQPQPVHFQGFFNVSHETMQDSPLIWNYLLSVTTHPQTDPHKKPKKLQFL
jgi:hypothetical protein